MPVEKDATNGLEKLVLKSAQVAGYPAEATLAQQQQM